MFLNDVPHVCNFNVVKLRSSLQQAIAAHFLLSLISNINYKIQGNNYRHSEELYLRAQEKRYDTLKYFYVVITDFLFLNANYL